MKIEGIQSEDELKKAQASAQAQGTTISNYKEWEEILKNFDEYGIQSTGTYAGDRAKMQEIEAAVAEFAEEIAVEQQNQMKPSNKEDEKVQENSKTDKQQDLKATVANATSSQIMADYMKYYHMLM